MNTFKFNVKFLVPLESKTVMEMEGYWKEDLEQLEYKIDSSHGTFHKDDEGKYTRADYKVCFVRDLDGGERRNVEDCVYDAYKTEGFRCNEPWVWRNAR